MERKERIPEQSPASDWWVGYSRIRPWRQTIVVLDQSDISQVKIDQDSAVEN